MTKNKSKKYFDENTDIEICKFISTTNNLERQKIFDTGIRGSFEKLIENIIFVYKFYSLDDIDTFKRECLSNLYEMLPKFNPEHGSSGFSYFNVVTKNWFIARVRERNKQMLESSNVEISKKNTDNIATDSYDDALEEQRKWASFYNTMSEWNKNDKLDAVEKKVIENIQLIMKNSERLQIFTKKAVYLYLKELSGLSSKQIFNGLSKARRLYLDWKKKYSEE